MTTLHDAALAGDLAHIRQLLATGASSVDERNEYKSTALLYAAKTHQLDAARVLIEHGAAINLVNTSQMTALHCAASSGDLAICQLLVSEGGDLSAVDEDGDTPSDVAADGGWREVREFLDQARRAEAEAELREAAAGGDARKLFAAIEQAEDQEVVGRESLAAARESLANLRRRGAPAADREAAAAAEAARAAEEQAAQLAAAKLELAATKEALAAAAEQRARQETKMLVAAAAVCVVMVSVLVARGVVARRR